MLYFCGLQTLLLEIRVKTGHHAPVFFDAEADVFSLAATPETTIPTKALSVLTIRSPCRLLFFS